MDATSNILENKALLITGGTGSFGQAFTKIALQHDPKVVRIFSRGELLQQEMSLKFNDERLRFFIGDVRDKSRIHRATKGVDIIIHAAALKQIPACEYNPIEAVRTNIEGSVNIIDAAIDNQVDKVIGISSDKACAPINLYGVTKACMEKLLIQANSYTGGRKTKFSCVRYGNVIGSRGSIMPRFLEQKRRGIITITDERMTRFWITLEQGVHFVINCIDMMRGGEVFVPKIPSMRVMDLANTIAPKAEKQFIGIRPGEKLNEVLITEDEARHTREFEDYLVIVPQFMYWTEDTYLDETGKPLPEGFRYASDTNDKWLTKEEIGRLINEN